MKVTVINLKTIIIVLLSYRSYEQYLSAAQWVGSCENYDNSTQHNYCVPVLNKIMMTGIYIIYRELAMYSGYDNRTQQMVVIL